MKNVIARKTRYPLNLQLFAEDDEETTPATPPVKTEFTAEQQVEMNRVIADRLARQQAKFDAEKTAAETEAQRLQREQNEEYKALYETSQAELVRVQGEAKTAQINALKTQLLVKAGYAADQITRVGKFVSGDDEEALQASIDEIKADIPPKASGVDPNPGNGRKNDPVPQGPEAKVKARFDRLKAQGKI
ncbi:multidrug efflux pump subunit AcrA (membrane-fusion protein) [Paenibacillus sp. DS2015]|uniref:hypothetical protein n=1 Tax=Paenibacillus sp. DS2015 TaxID=3373917 RepID=UPI003D197FC8